MTPPDNTGGGTSQGAGDVTTSGEGGGAGSSGSTSPPWQRVARDGNASAAGYDVEDRMTQTGDLPVVTGTAAQGLFGNPPAETTAEQRTDYFEQPNAGKGQRNVEGATLGTRGRSTPSALRRPGRGPRRASLMVKRVDPWSVLKLSLVLGVAMFLVWMVAVGLLYIVLDGMGVWDKLNGTYTSLVSGEGTDSVAEPLISAGRVFGVAAIVGMVNIVLLSALATVSAFIYNVSADLAGGLEITLSERE
ncbi:MAG: DUF3566 domain-containing protein [Thermocrispum sp.]